MSQGLRDMLANRKFSIPLIALLALCLIGIFMIGIVIIFQPGWSGAQAALEGDTLALAVEDAAFVPTETLEPTQTPSPTTTPTPKPTATLVPVGTVTSQAAPVVTVLSTDQVTVEVQPTLATPAAPAQPAAQATVDPGAADSELAETGVGWGLVLVSGVGLAALALIARRLRLAN